MMAVQQIKIVKNILAGNDQMAERNRQYFQSAGIFAVNVMASPGAGKTSLITRTIESMGKNARIGVIEGDIAGSIDTEKVLEAGAVDAIQINTGGNCHLEANMIQKALESLDLSSIDMLFIENVGNLICPTHWSLGEDIKICLLSIPEGHDKPVKYPEIFAASNAILLNKIDMMDRTDFDRDFFYQSVRTLNPQAPVFEISCRSGEGIEDWVGWLRDKQGNVERIKPG
jgi:hydrogenase nickel incorporation protein HypB